MTKIEWTAAPGYKGETWNPVTGCTKVSAGCKNCYAEALAPRVFAGQMVPIPMPPHHSASAHKAERPRRFTDVRCHPERLDRPLRWRKPRMVFVNSMSDLFHEDVPNEFIDRVFAVMAQARKHTFQVLTKRPERMRQYMSGANDRVTEVMHDLGRLIESHWSPSELITAYAKQASDYDAAFGEWPKSNVWLGVSCEDQATADERIPILLDTPAAIRFVSAEPLLGPIQFHCDSGYGRALDWVIVGGESGPRARPCDVAWVRSTVEQCKAAGVPVFVKQLGAQPFVDLMEPQMKGRWRLGPWHYRVFRDRQGHGTVILRDPKGGDPAEWPEDLRVREWPGDLGEEPAS